MLNLTARLAVQIQHLPDWEIDWNDTTPQRDPSTLTITDILPNEGDGQKLKKRAVQYVMQFLVTEFSCLNHLESFLQNKESPHCVNKSNVVPIKMLLKMKSIKQKQSTSCPDLLWMHSFQANQRYEHVRNKILACILNLCTVTCRYL